VFDESQLQLAAVQAINLGGSDSAAPRGCLAMLSAAFTPATLMPAMQWTSGAATIPSSRATPPPL
jgi:hypothetical protein